MSEQRTLVDAGGRTHRFPPPLEHAYVVEDGRVRTRSLEAHVVDHCNLTCAECCSLSPLLPPRLTSPGDLARDLALAARVLAPRVFKLVGGEPLLHPEIVELARVARRSRIAPRLSLTTNGLLLPKMPDALWQELDALTVSRYPTPALPGELVAEVEAKAARFHVALNWKQQDGFVTMSLPRPREDEAETAAIWSRCWLRERCHLLQGGRFYTCTRPVHLQTRLGPAHDLSGDGLSLDGTTADTLLTYLRREPPLAACAHCAGGDAPMEPHRLLPAAELRRLRAAPAAPAPAPVPAAPAPALTPIAAAGTRPEPA
jgi:cyclic pyranopterin phosphate synthase